MNRLESQIEYIRNAPKDNGLVKMIVIRPKKDERQTLKECYFSFKGGVEGDNWALGCWKSLPDGSPHPDVQVSITNSRVLETIEPSENRRALAGNNLVVDLDLSDESLKPGDKLHIGDAVLEITDTPHNGCKKYQDRFGAETLKFVNSKTGKQLHLRGIVTVRSRAY
ncbi:hypothetical protein MLD52_22935 [Puniceicoccaceae bacterium K14]|nr:hypothetical protein [Puniceicoccaceae bacterium K14]